MKRLFFTFGALFIFLLFAGASCISLSGDQPVTSGPAGMFLSKDKGESWKAITALPTATGVSNLSKVNVYRFFDDPQDPNAYYLTTREHGMFYTYDNGTTWQRPVGPMAAGIVYGLSIHPKDKCTITATNGSQIYKSTDCNRTWKEIYTELRTGIRIVGIAFEKVAPYGVYVAENNGDILYSADAGISWTVSNKLSGSPISIEFSTLQPKYGYIVTKANGLYRTTDGGKNWVLLAEPLSKFSGSLEVRRFFVHPTVENRLFWISTYGILISDDSGDSWRDIKLITPPGSVNINAFTINPKNQNEIYYTATLKDNSRSTFYKSIDGGENWKTEKLPSGQIPVLLKVHPVFDNWLFLGFAAPISK